MARLAADRVLPIALGVLFLGFLWTIHDVFEQRIVQAGDRVPDFSVTTEDGRKLSRSDFGGKLLVLNFWATWCPPCIEEMPALDGMQRALKDSGVVVLGVSIDKNKEAYRRFLQRTRPAFLTALDPEANISSDFGTFRWPETYVISRDGRVLQKHIGVKNWTDPGTLAELKALL